MEKTWLIIFVNTWNEGQMKSPDIISAVKPVVGVFDKLDWYRLGRGVSERQWNDVLGVLKVQKNLLDMKYPHHLASELGLVD